MGKLLIYSNLEIGDELKIAVTPKAWDGKSYFIPETVTITGENKSGKCWVLSNGRLARKDDLVQPRSPESETHYFHYFPSGKSFEEIENALCDHLEVLSREEAQEKNLI